MNTKALVLTMVAGLYVGGCESFKALDAPVASFEYLNQVVATGKELESKGYDGLAKAVDKWCEFTPALLRARVRTEVNMRTTKGDIEFCLPETGANASTRPISGVQPTPTGN